MPGEHLMSTRKRSSSSSSSSSSKPTTSTKSTGEQKNEQTEDEPVPSIDDFRNDLADVVKDYEDETENEVLPPPAINVAPPPASEHDRLLKSTKARLRATQKVQLRALTLARWVSLNPHQAPFRWPDKSKKMDVWIQYIVEHGTVQNPIPPCNNPTAKLNAIKEEANFIVKAVKRRKEEEASSRQERLVERREHALRSTLEALQTMVHTFRTNKEMSKVPHPIPPKTTGFDQVLFAEGQKCANHLNDAVYQCTTSGIASDNQVVEYNKQLRLICKKFEVAVASNSQLPPSTANSSSSTSTTTTTTTTSTTTTPTTGHMSLEARWKLYTRAFFRILKKHYHVQLARGPTGDPIVVPPLSNTGQEVLYYVCGWMVRSTAKKADPMIKQIMKNSMINVSRAMTNKLPVGCIRRRRPLGGGTFISKKMFLFFLELERICRGFAVPSVLRRLRATFAPAVLLYTETNKKLAHLALTLVKEYKFPIQKKRLAKDKVIARNEAAAKVLVNILVERYLPLRTEEALRWLMEDIGVRKSDGGAIRTTLKHSMGDTEVKIIKSEK